MPVGGELVLRTERPMARHGLLSQSQGSAMARKVKISGHLDI